MGKTKIYGISFGATWVLFVGMLFGHYGLTIDHELIHFLKEFGLVLFVYSIGLQVGPGFFSSFRPGGVALNSLAVFVLVSGLITVIGIHFLFDVPATTVTGIMSRACTNPPALAYASEQDSESDKTSVAYATVYPLSMFLRVLTAQLLILFLA